MTSLNLRRLVSAIGLSVAIITAVLTPLGYFYIGYANQAIVLDYKAGLAARYVSRYIYSHASLWQYQRVRLAEILDQTEIAGDLRNRILDARGIVVLDEGPPVETPVLTRTAPIAVAGRHEGQIEVATSLRPLLWQTAGISVLSMLLGLCVYFAVRTLPLRVLDKTLGVLQTTNQRFDAALSNMSQGLCMFDADRRLVICNRRFIEIFKLAPDAIKPGMTPQEVAAVTIGKNALRGQNSDEFVTERKDVWDIRKPALSVKELADGRVINLAYRPMPTGGWVTTFEDITEQRRSQAMIAHMARHDALTNLPNRIQFREELEKSLIRRRGEERVAILSLDLDHFKNVNDTLGHPVGDLLLKAVADRLRACLRESDSVARLGGDEFAVVQDATASQPADSSALASRLIDVLGEPFNIEGQQVVVGASIGISLAPTDGTDADVLLKNADMALYRAKAEGRTTYQFFEPEMDARAQARRILELDLRAALKNDEFELYYQPIVDLRSGRIVTFEALVRWNHPHRGVVAPLDFIPLAEETALIVPLGAWVLRRACADAASWPRDINVAVNISPIQFRSRDLVQTVVSAVTSAGLDPSRVEIEITESVLLNNSEKTLATLHALRDFGVRISMDDFGTGYSSLSYLRSFPFDKIKIDSSFIRDLSTQQDCMAIVRAVTGLGNSLGIATTAEGVETSEQLSLLRGEGCDEVQGYLCSPPRPAADVKRLILENSKLYSAA